MVLQLPIPNQSLGQLDDSSAIASSNSSLHNRDVVSATPVTSNLASGVYPIGLTGVQRPNLSSNVNLNLQQKQQQLMPQPATNSASSLQYPNQIQNSPMTQQMIQPSMMQHSPQNNMMPNNMMGGNTSAYYTNPSLYNFNATQMMSQYNQQLVGNPQQVTSTSMSNIGINNSSNVNTWMRMGGGQPSNPLGKVTVGGRSLLNATMNSNGGDGSSNNNNSNNMTSFLGGRGRIEGTPTRPPLSAGKSKLQLPSATNTNTITNMLQQTPSKVVNFEESPASAIDDGAINEVDHQETALTTQLLTLSVHEALTFDGVELALHPDLFKESNRNKLHPGDLVEIRVWSARPGVTTTKSKSKPSSISKAATGAKPALHSRNTSLASASSSIFANSSISSSSPNVKILDQTTPVPNEVFRDPKSSQLSDKNHLPPVQPSLSESSPGILLGEQCLEGSPSNEGAPVATSSTSSLLAGAASTLSRNTNTLSDGQTPPLTIPSQQATSVSSSESGRLQGTSLDDSTIASHSRESSVLTNSTLAGLHSRDSSFLAGMHSRDSSLLNQLPLSNSGSPTKESPQNSQLPSTAAEAVDEVQPHPLVSNLSGISNKGQSLLARRDGPSLSTPAALPAQLHSQKGAAVHIDTKSAILTSTPLSTALPSTTKQGVINNKSPSNKSPSNKSPSSKSPSSKSPLQRPPVALPREQRTDTNKNSHAHNDSISSTTPTPSAGMTGTMNHRRYNSGITASSSTAPLLPPAHRSNTRSSMNAGVINRENSEDGMAVDVLESLQETHFVRTSFVMPVSDEGLKSIKSSARTKVSLLRRVADLYQITGFDTITVTQVPRRDTPFVQQQISADFVTITFKDQFVSRGDMFYFQRSFLNSWVYEGKRLSFNGIRTNTKVIRHGDHAIRSGIISEDTKLTFRSRSARIIWLVQISYEFWDFASPYKAVGNQKNKEPSCETYFNKFISFARKLFEKWKKLELTHNLTVVFFSRTFIRHKEDPSRSNGSSAVHTNSDGRTYCDNYKIVLNNETTADWSSLIYRMKQAFVNYPKEVKWDLSPGMERIPSTAGQGNILEAINMTLNLLHLHFIDRDLHRTGNSIVIMTAGNGVFEVEKNLAGITKQRMMDNGIGSDMLSLGLPPLHVIPFFLFRNENKENTAEEMQGFDDDGGATSRFEVPHWMNLSYVDYDDEEEAMLYKEHINDDDVNDEQHENNVDSTPWDVSNGFLRRNKPVYHDQSAPISVPTSDVGATATAKDHARHLISQRGFEDILQACRPRNRGEYGSGLPISLSNLLRKFSPNINHSIQASEKTVSLEQSGGLSPQRSLRAKNLEWGAVSFDEFNMTKVSSSLQRSQFYRMSASLSDSSSASSFTSLGSSMFVSQTTSGMHLQSTMSLSLEGGQPSAINHVDSSPSIDDVENPQEDNGNPASMLERMMQEHDANAFSVKSGRESPTNSVFASSFNSGNAESPKIEASSPLARSQSAAVLPSRPGGGIEAALAQYDELPDSGAAKPGISVPVSADKRLSTSPLISNMPFTFSLDRRNEGYNPNITRLGPERIAAISEGLHSTEFHRRNSSKGIGDRRGSFALGSSKQQVTAESLSKTPNEAMSRNKSKKQSYQHRYRRKVWVLNPFRQEDEDEVLAKRTHNRRRWSHVFPLGEAEFKKHAGPNWKSLCQPAILPMTIDFHPEPSELEDQDKFRIKQYSVTLPSMDETNYKDATELLDDLMVQRVRQDFQLVPRSILSAHRETDNTEYTLSRTLSMGHKIQKLSYNPSSDSVDVVQYYANFAENESPQSYRYLLWSALRQDYVSVVQTFTKYTSPYKWNELDMLISGDTISSISEDMRHPRISFVILPDPFTDQNGESGYSSKFQRLVEYFNKLQTKGSITINIETITKSDEPPKASKGKRSFIVDLRRRNNDKYEWCEIVHDSNCDTRRTFRITIQWLVAIGSKIDQQAQLLHRRCAQYGLNLIRVPNYSSLRLCFLNPYAVPITIPVRNKLLVNILEEALTKDFGFVYDGSHMADPNELVDCLDGFDFVVNRWSMNKRKKFVPAKQYIHRSGTLFVRLLRDSQGKAISIIYLNNLHIAGDTQLLECARAIFNDVEHFITEEQSKLDAENTM